MTSGVQTERDRKVLKFIKEYHKKHSYSPSLREIMDACDLKSSSMAKWEVDRLILMGELVSSGQPGLARAYAPAAK